MNRVINQILMWYSIPGYEGYYVINRDGEVKGRDRCVALTSGAVRFYKSKKIKTRKNNWGYHDVRLSREGVTKTFLVHRLLAEVFIPNFEKKPYVNHKNGIKTDNRLENLEWVTHSENIIHAYLNGLCTNREKRHYNAKALVNKETGQVFFTLRQAAEEYGVSYSSFRNYLNTHDDPRFEKL